MVFVLLFNNFISFLEQYNMHIPDGIISGTINIATGVVAAAFVGISIRKTSRIVQNQPQIMPLIAMTGAFVFAGQMLNFPIGGGTSGHFLGAALVAALLGPWTACLVMATVLAIQCFGFADGGISALGTNIFNMGVIGAFSAYAMMRLFRRFLPNGRNGFVATVAVSAGLSILLAAVACAIQIAASGTSPIQWVLPVMATTHLVIGIGEGLITVAVISAVAVTRPDILPEWASVDSIPNDKKNSIWIFSTVGLIVAVILATIISPFASGAPDGLEKTLDNNSHVASLEKSEIQFASPLPDYSVPGIASEKISTGFSGLLGTIAMFVIGFAIIKLSTKQRKMNVEIVNDDSPDNRQYNE